VKLNYSRCVLGWFTLYNHCYEPKTGYDMT